MNVTEFVIHDAGGRILMHGRASEVEVEATAATRAGATGYVEGVGDTLTHYVREGQVIDRPANPAQLAGATLTSLPNPCSVWINGVEYACHDDTADLAFDQVGKYQIKVVAFPFLDAEFAYENQPR